MWLGIITMKWNRTKTCSLVQSLRFVFLLLIILYLQFLIILPSLLSLFSPLLPFAFSCILSCYQVTISIVISNSPLTITAPVCLVCPVCPVTQETPQTPVSPFNFPSISNFSFAFISLPYLSFQERCKWGNQQLKENEITKAVCGHRYPCPNSVAFYWLYVVIEAAARKGAMSYHIYDVSRLFLNGAS